MFVYNVKLCNIAVNLGGIDRLELGFLYLVFFCFFAEEIWADFQKSSGNTGDTVSVCQLTKATSNSTITITACE